MAAYMNIATVRDMTIIDSAADLMETVREANRNIDPDADPDDPGALGTASSTEFAVYQALGNMIYTLQDEHKYDDTTGTHTGGYSKEAAVSVVGRGAYRALERRRIVKGAKASDKVPTPEARIKSDGKGAVSLYNNAARNGRVNRQRDTKAAAYIHRGTEKGKAIARRHSDVQKSFTPLPEGEEWKRAWAAQYSDIDDPEVIAAIPVQRPADPDDEILG